MKKLIVILAIIFSFVANGQVYTPVIATQYGNHLLRAKVDLVSHIVILPDTSSLHSTDTSAQWGIYHGRLYWHYGYWRDMAPASSTPTWEQTLNAFLGEIIINPHSIQLGTNTFEFSGSVSSVITPMLKLDGNTNQIYFNDVPYTFPSALGSPGSILSDLAGDGNLSWEAFVSPGLQDVITKNPVLTVDNTIDATQHSLTINNLSSFATISNDGIAGSAAIQSGVYGVQNSASNLSNNWYGALGVSPFGFSGDDAPQKLVSYNTVVNSDNSIRTGIWVDTLGVYINMYPHNDIASYMQSLKLNVDSIASPYNVLWVDKSDSTVHIGAYPSGGGSQDLQDVTDIGNTTTNEIKSGVAHNFVKLAQGSGGGNVIIEGAGGQSIISSDNLNNSYINQLPDAAGTFVLSVNGINATTNGDITLSSSDVGAVPYSGATGDIDLGNHSLITTGHIKSDYWSTGSTRIDFSNSSGGLIFRASNSTAFLATISTNTITANRTYTGQDASGTLAFLSDVVLKVNIGDTLSMLSTYLRSNIASATYQPLGSYQTALVSGTNIKTVNSSSLLGSGNLAVGDLLASNNLSDILSASTARSNLGLIIGTNVLAYSANVVYNNQANIYTAGMKQSFSADATNAGVRWVGVTANPSSLSSGDLWFRTDELKFKYYDGTTTRSFVTEALAQTITNKDFTSGTNTFPSSLALIANPLSQFATTTSSQFRGVLSDKLGTGAALFDGATPTGFVLTNATGLPLTTGITGILGASNGGTGVNNSSTITLGGNLVTSGAFGLTLTQTGTTNVTLPTSGTLLTTTGSGSSLTGIPTSVSNADGSITISPTTGSVVASLNVSNANTFTGIESFSRNTTTSSSQAVKIIPTNNASAGTPVRWSPAFLLRSDAWNTTATAAHNNNDFIFEVVPVSGATTSSSLYIRSQINGGTVNDILQLSSSGNMNIANGSITLGTAGNKINITTGTNGSTGTAILVGGTVTVSTTAVTASSKIFLTDATTGALTNIGTPTVGTIVSGTSFVINSSNILDTSAVNWWIIN